MYIYIYIYKTVIVRFVEISEVEVIIFVVESVNSSPQIPFFLIFGEICCKKFAHNASAVCRH